MYLIPDLPFYTIAFNDVTYFNREYLDIAFNPNNSFIINREIIEAIEQSIEPENREYFAAFLREIFDNNRAENCESIKVDNYKNTCLSYFTSSNKEFLIPIRVGKQSNFNKVDFLNLLDITSNDEFDVHRKALLTHSYIHLTYQDFKSNEEIENFIENLFSIPKYINEVHCFNRDISKRFIEKLKDKKINYYTLIKHPIRRYLFEYKEVKSDFKKTVSGKFKLYTITDRTLIHERKIFINNLCINFDNAFDNILIEEPTWEITITYDKNKFDNWKKKIIKFKSIN